MHNRSFVSLGRYCCVKYHLSLQTSQPTLFFDWLLIDIESVCQVLESYPDVSRILNPQKFRIHPNRPNEKGFTRFFIDTLPSCQSLHDVKGPLSRGARAAFVEKYNQRFERFVNEVLSERPLFLIHYGVVSESQAKRIVKAIKQINPNGIFRLVSLVEKAKATKMIVDTGCYGELDLEYFLLPPRRQDDWKKGHWDWKRVFACIDAFYSNK